MSTIWLDPVELRASSAFLGEQAGRVQETMTGTRSACACEVPRSLIGWLDAELQAITTEALLSAVGYLVDAIDIALRADGIAADQSLATTQAGELCCSTNLPGPAVAGTAVGAALPVGLGGVGASFVPGGAVADPEVARTNQMLTEMIVSSAGPSFIDVIDSSADGMRTLLAPPGVSYDDGAYVDGGGDRSTSLATAYEDPVTGELDF